MAKLKVSSPWVTYYHELKAFFQQDTDVTIVYDEDENQIKLYVADGEKADALGMILPYQKEFGNVVLKIAVIPPNNNFMNRPLADTVAAYQKALKNNPAVSYIKTCKCMYHYDITFVVFNKKVVQYFNDILFDINGVCSTLYENLARNIFEETENIYFCTDTRSTNVLSCSGYITKG